MNNFLSWCMHLLVPFLFHEVTSLHPPSFHRNDFSTCYGAHGFYSTMWLRIRSTVLLVGKALRSWSKLDSGSATFFLVYYQFSPSLIIHDRLYNIDLPC